MTRKDYVLIAEALDRSRPFTVSPPDRFHDVRVMREQWERDRQQIMDVLARDNPRFNHDRFMAACEGTK